MKENDLDNTAFQTSRCELCDSENFVLICSRDDGSRVAICSNCDLVSVNPLPDQSYLNSTYQPANHSPQSKTWEAYFKIAQNTQKELDSKEKIDIKKIRQIEAKKSFKKRYRERLKLIERFSRHKGKLLDLGCGEGHFLKYAESQGWDVSGIDILAINTEFAKEILQIKNVQCVPLGEVLFPEQSFDVATLYDLIEHLSHPLNELKKINKLLQLGGLLVISTPNIKNSIFMKERWPGYIINQHIHFFSLKTLTQMLKQSGFRVVFSTTGNAKKGLLIPKEFLPGKIRKRPKSLLGRLWYSIKRDFRNTFNFMTYTGALFSMCGYGFNLIVVAVKDSTKN
jgi:2-polyprenyl-3-methyl-5-hydroxy-6-metoxy-1,4-benzoquinol methylase